MEAIIRKYKSFALTVRPRDGVTDEHIASFVKLAKRVSEFYFVATEKEGSERHIHAGLFLKEAIDVKGMNRQLVRVYKDFDDDEQRTLRKGTRIMYNIDFIENYIGDADKGDVTVVVAKELPEAKFLEGYWPSKAEQNKAIALSATDKFYAKLERLWFETRDPGVDINRDTVAVFIYDMMFKSRKIRVLRDQKHIKNVVWLLERYLKKDVSGDISYAPWE